MDDYEEEYSAQDRINRQRQRELANTEIDMTTESTETETEKPSHDASVDVQPVVSVQKLGKDLSDEMPLSHEGCDAFWKYWEENGETHKHGHYESTWGAISAYLKKASETTDQRAH